MRPIATLDWLTCHRSRFGLQASRKLLPRGDLLAEDNLHDVVYGMSQGLTTSRSRLRKSATFRVATARSFALAIPAIKAPDNWRMRPEHYAGPRHWAAHSLSAMHAFLERVDLPTASSCCGQFFDRCSGLLSGSR